MGRVGEKTKPIKANQLHFLNWFLFVLIRGYLMLQAHKKSRPQLCWSTGSLKRLINYPASFSAGFTTLNFYLLDSGFRSSHGTTPGCSGRTAAAFFSTTRLRAGNRTRFFAAALFDTARLRTFCSTWRLVTGCRFGLCGHLRTRCRLGRHRAAGHFA